MAGRERHPRTPKRPRFYYAVAAVCAAVAVLAVASLAQAAVPPPAPPAAEARPDWAVRPTSEDVVRYYPARARRDGVEGRAVVSCSVEPSGALADCTIVDESPPGRGFGRAVLEMAGTSFRITAREPTGEPNPRVRVPVVFQLEDFESQRPEALDQDGDSVWRWVWVLGLMFGASHLLGDTGRRRWAYQAGSLARRILSTRRLTVTSASRTPAPPAAAVPPSRTPDIVQEARRRWPWSPDRR